jgi:hypothetical protein
MFVARGAQWSGPEINIGTMAAPGAMINAKKTPPSGGDGA